MNPPLPTIDLRDYSNVVFFTGAGMSAECGVPTYRGRGGIWSQYRWEAFACERAFRQDPDAVLDFHEMRRAMVLSCQVHAGHRHLACLQKGHESLSIVTQNTDGMHQRAGSPEVIELHGNLFRVRCPVHGRFEDANAGPYARRHCAICGERLRPDITWFEDALDAEVWSQAEQAIHRCDLFVSVGTSGAVWPAAGLAELAVRRGAMAMEINPEENDASSLYRVHLRCAASVAIPRCFHLGAQGI